MASETRSDQIYNGKISSAWFCHNFFAKISNIIMRLPGCGNRNFPRAILHLNKSEGEEKKRQRFVHLWLNSICLTAVILFNVMICFAVYKDKRLRTPSNALLLSLSIADLLVVVEFVVTIVQLSVDVDNTICEYIAPYHYVVVNIIILHLVAISIDRLLAIQCHLRYAGLVTSSRMTGAILILWCLGILWSVLPIVLFPQDSQHELKDFTKILLDCTKTRPTCRRAWLDNQVSRNLCRMGWNKAVAKNTAKQHMLYALLSNFILPFVIILFSYAWILKTSITHHKKIKAQVSPHTSNKHTKLRAADTVAIIIVCFLVCFAPMFAVSMVQAYKRPCWKGRRITNKLLFFLSSLSAALNPLIYAGRNESFRNVYRKMLKSNAVGHSKWITEGESSPAWEKEMGSMEERNTEVRKSLWNKLATGSQIDHS